MNFLDRISEWWNGSNKPPLDSTAYATGLGQPQALAHWLTVPRLQSILRQAEAGECQDLFSLYREIRLSAHLQTVLNQRKLQVLTKALTIVPEDPKNPADVLAAKQCSVLTKRPGWSQVALNHLLNGHVYPVAVLEQVYEAAPANALGIRYQPRQWAAVPYHLLDYTDGKLQIWDADPVLGHRLNTKKTPLPIRHIVHRGHLLADIPDNWGGPMRAALFWWLFATMDRDWWVRFLDRFGAPFIIGKYDSADNKAKSVLANAFSQATRLFGLVVSKETEIQVQAVASNSHGEAFKAMQEFANGELSKLFLGQTMTTTAQAGGLGGAQANVQDGTRQDIEAWDLIALASTVNTQIIEPFRHFNGIQGRAELQVAADTTAELAGKTAFLEAAVKAGLAAADAAIAQLSDASGIQLQRAGAAAPAAPPAPGADPTAKATPAPGGDDVASQAMNGAQVTSLIEVIKAVAAKEISLATGTELLRNAFPGIPEESILKMLAPAAAAPAPAAFSAESLAASAAAILAKFGQPSDDELGRLAAASAPSLADAFTGRYAAIPGIIAASTSAADLEHRLHLAFPTLSEGRLQGVLEDSLTAFAALGSATAARQP